MEMKQQNVKGRINAELVVQQRPRFCQNPGVGEEWQGLSTSATEQRGKAGPPAHICQLWARRGLLLSKLGPHWVLMEISVEVM